MITTYDQFKEKVSKGVNVVVFTADWVPLSKRLYEEIARYMSNFSVNVLEVDIGMAPKVAHEERVFVVPTVKVYIDGKAVITQEDTTGSVSVDAEHLRRALKGALKSRGIPLR
ncbi:MAG: thioredoxin family protein [Crenarchaeota archaeon]|nr:thioredoxin family protein [Thermoproteota archaeon]